MINTFVYIIPEIKRKFNTFCRQNIGGIILLRHKTTIWNLQYVSEPSLSTCDKYRVFFQTATRKSLIRGAEILVTVFHGVRHSTHNGAEANPSWNLVLLYMLISVHWISRRHARILNRGTLRTNSSAMDRSFSRWGARRWEGDRTAER